MIVTMRQNPVNGRYYVASSEDAMPDSWQSDEFSSPAEAALAAEAALGELQWDEPPEDASGDVEHVATI